MRWRLRAGLLIVAAALALGACADAAEPAEPAEWAAGVCTAGQTFNQAIIDSRDDVADPSSLELAERKGRAARLGEAEIAAAKQLVEELDTIEPPEAAREFHNALITQANDLVRAIEAQVEAIEEATTAQQIAVANASAQFEAQASRTEVNAAAAALPDELAQALAEQPECGQVPVPGEPTAPAPTPAA